MTEQSLSINFSGGEIYDYLLIEQEPWPEDVGKTTVLQGLAGMAALLFNTEFPLANCGGDSAGFDTDVFVYPSRLDMRYKFDISHGEFTPDVFLLLQRDEMKQCGYVASVELDYPPINIPSLEWVGDCYDNRGAIVSKPTITVAGRTIYFSKLVYGSLRARYTVFRNTYKIRVESRDDAIENNFDSVVYCVWDGGIQWMDCSPPSGYDITKGICGNGIGDTDIEDPEPDPDPDKPPESTDGADLEIKIDYCSQEEISRRTVGN